MPASGLLGVSFWRSAARAAPAQSVRGDGLRRRAVHGAGPRRAAEPNISAPATHQYTVHPSISLERGACAPYTVGYVEAADIRPWMMGPDAAADVRRLRQVERDAGADGTAQVNSYNAILGAGCIAADYYDDGARNFGLTCVSTTTPTVVRGPPGTSRSRAARPLLHVLRQAARRAVQRADVRHGVGHPDEDARSRARPSRSIRAATRRSSTPSPAPAASPRTTRRPAPRGSSWSTPRARSRSRSAPRGTSPSTTSSRVRHKTTRR